MDAPTTYTLHVASELDPNAATRFDGMQVLPGGGTTRIRGPVADQAALHGLLARIRDMGLVLLAVQREDA